MRTMWVCFITNLHKKFHMPSTNGSSDVAIKLKANNQDFRTATTLLHV